MAREFSITERARVPVGFAFAWYTNFHADDLRLMGAAGTRRAQPLGPARIGVDSRLAWWLGGMRIRYDVTLRPEAHAYDARAECVLFRGVATYAFHAEVDGETRMTSSWRLDGGIGRWAAPAFVARALLRYTTRNLFRAMEQEHALARAGRTLTPDGPSGALAVATQE